MDKKKQPEMSDNSPMDVSIVEELDAIEDELDALEDGEELAGLDDADFDEFPGGSLSMEIDEDDDLEGFNGLDDDDVDGFGPDELAMEDDELDDDLDDDEFDDEFDDDLEDSDGFDSLNDLENEVDGLMSEIWAPEK